MTNLSALNQYYRTADTNLQLGDMPYGVTGYGPDGLVGIRPDSTTDPFWPYVELLLKGEGSNGQTTFTDSSNAARTVTRGGDAIISNGQAKFGSTSIYLDGSGDYLQLADSDAWHVGKSDFTVDGWVYALGFNHAGGAPSFMGQRASNTSLHAWTCYFTSSGVLGFAWTTNGSTSNAISSGANTAPTNEWAHIAYVRHRDRFLMFINGIQVGEATGFTHDIYNSNQTLKVGAFDAPAWSGSYFYGYMQEMRFTRNVARYTRDFVVPALAYPVSA